MEKQKIISPENSLEKFLINRIPITSAMGVRVELATLNKVILKAPFSQNLNHKNTVFGGSLHSLATLSCWSLLYLNLIECYTESTQIVITTSEIKYLVPVTMDFQSECEMSSTLEWNRFRQTLERKNKARLYLNAKIFQKDHLCVNFKGGFAAMNSNCG